MAHNQQSHLAGFQNAPYADFTQPETRMAMEAALARVRGELGQVWTLMVAGERIKTGDTFDSTNPARPDEVIGTHQKANPILAARAVEAAYEAFPAWSRTPAADRIAMAHRAAAILRERRMDLNAWLVLEAGKTWVEAEAESGEAIDFCDYYAWDMARLDGAHNVLELPGEQGEMRYLPLGVGIVIPPWNFPLAILAGMTVAALVTGNTVVIKPSSDTPTVAAVFAEVLLEAGFPATAFAFITGSGGIIGDALVGHPKTRFVSFTGSRDVGLHINGLAAKPQPGQIWIKRVVAEMGGKDAIIVDAECDLAAAVEGVTLSAFGYQGQKCSACSRAIVHADVYDEFLARLKPRVEQIAVGSPEDPAFYMGPVISAAAKKTILNYIQTGTAEGRLLTGGDEMPGDGHFIQPTVIADITSSDRVFQEEIFGPVLAVTKARDFQHALELANDTEYGLTGALYSSNPEHIRRAREEFFVGNLYINRKCTGAMVGCHPFGGFNMSGTDSKAGGPDYLQLFLQAKSIAEKKLC
jgi:1-pyrroline-5-carboxylate dehydrogenase